MVLPVGDEATVTRVEREKAFNAETTPFYSFSAYDAPATVSLSSPSATTARSMDDIKELQHCGLAEI